MVGNTSTATHVKNRICIMNDCQASGRESGQWLPTIKTKLEWTVLFVSTTGRKLVFKLS